MNTTPKLKHEYDSPWKSVLDKFFREFMQLLFPDCHALINWDIAPEMLDKELVKFANDAANNTKIVDKLVKVTMLDGHTEYVCIHIEIQATKSQDFAARMFNYYCRIFSRHGKPIISLAVLLDQDHKWRPCSFAVTSHQTTMKLEFEVAKILDFGTHIAQLQKSSNPFAVIILAQLAVIGTSNDQIKLTSKKEIVRLLYGRGFDRTTMYELMVFIDWVIKLPAALDRECKEFIAEVDGESSMKYVPTFLRSALEEGLERGMVDGQRAMIVKQLEHKFVFVADNYRDMLRKYNTEQLLNLSARLLDASSIEQVFAGYEERVL